MLRGLEVGSKLAQRWWITNMVRCPRECNSATDESYGFHQCNSHCKYTVANSTGQNYSNSHWLNPLFSHHWPSSSSHWPPLRSYTFITSGLDDQSEHKLVAQHAFPPGEGDFHPHSWGARWFLQGAEDLEKHRFCAPKSHSQRNALRIEVITYFFAILKL